MSATPHDHPERSELEAFGMGRLDPPRSAEVEQHIAGCESCWDTVHKAPDDTQVRQPHEVVNQLPQAAPASVVSAVQETVDYPSPVADAVEAPKDLARHPRYRLLKLLGHGGMGAVYQAEHSVMRRLVALKVINREYTAEPSVVERFRREIRAAAQLHHANIVSAYDAEQAGETHFLVMEYIDGVSLDQMLAKRGPLPIAEACEYVRQAALGLHHAHERGMVHRDVKPHNLIRTADGVVKVLDFGLASVAENDESNLTGTYAVVGTADYMAPEQAESARAADARSDIYALGCTLYHLLSGRPPFTDPSTLLKLVAHREEAPPPVRALRHDVPEKLAAVIGRMMAKAPVDRFQTATEVAAALEPFAHAGRTGGDADAPDTAAEGSASQAWKRRRRWLVAGALAAPCLAVLAAAAVYCWPRAGNERVPPNRGDGMNTPPPLAVAPFDAATAKERQDAWAKHLAMKVEVNNSIDMKLALIPPGVFTMGSPNEEAGRFVDEGPQHQVEITRPFYLGAFPVTKGQFAAFIKDSGYQTEAEKAGQKTTWRTPALNKYDQTDNDPVVFVSRNDAVKFCAWLSKKEEKTYELPTEAEWEYACRAGTTTTYSVSEDRNTLGDYAWFDGNSGGHTHPVGGKKPNPWGLYDMHGNVWQFCGDAGGRYEGGYIKDPKYGNNGGNGIIRGGSWYKNSGNCRSALRVHIASGFRSNDVGFRVASRLPAKTP